MKTPLIHGAIKVGETIPVSVESGETQIRVVGGKN